MWFARAVNRIEESFEEGGVLRSREGERVSGLRINRWLEERLVSVIFVLWNVPNVWREESSIKGSESSKKEFIKGLSGQIEIVDV